MKTLKYDLDQTVASFILGMISSVVLVSAAIIINYFTINSALLLVGLLVVTLFLNALFGFLIYRHVMTINSAINKGLAGQSPMVFGLQVQMVYSTGITAPCQNTSSISLRLINSAKVMS